MSGRMALILAGFLGGSAVLLDAFGAHALRKAWAALSEGPQRMEWWEVANRYHFIHALALALVGMLISKSENALFPLSLSAWCFVLGIAFFSGSLYAMALSGARAFGAITPIGGLLFAIGWFGMAWAGLQEKW
ncbi:MAG: DUF423 domain-containing protein [Sandaracinaceae bacterium]|nr:DUF423 domain-containing protein [Sandaracinaceae bacterium]